MLSINVAEKFTFTASSEWMFISDSFSCLIRQFWRALKEEEKKLGKWKTWKGKNISILIESALKSDLFAAELSNKNNFCTFLEALILCGIFFSTKLRWNSNESFWDGENL